MTDDVFKSVAIREFPVFWPFMIDLCRALKERYNSQIHYYALHDGGTKFYKKTAPDLFDTINVVHPEVHDLLPVADPDAVYARARVIENEYGPSINWYMLLDRLKGRGFSPGGYFHPRAPKSKRATHVQVVDGINRLFSFWEHEFSEKGISLCFNPLFIEAAVARKFGAASTTASASRYENMHYWTTDEFGFSSEIESAFRNCELSDDEELTIDHAPHFQRHMQLILAKKIRFSRVIKKSLHKAYKHVYWHYKGSSKAGQYYFHSDVALYYREWRDMHRVSGPHMPKLKDIEGRRFVFYGLHVEPETAFQARSPEYFYQMAAITSAARDLPADVMLVVKEHIDGVGRRPTLMYEQIRELKNVIFIDILESGLEIVKQSDAVITICGTNGQEAAVMGKPVISFGRHNLYNFLPHVIVIRDEADLRGALVKALQGGIDKEQARRDGRRFLKSLKEISFDMKDFSYLNPEGYDSDSVETAIISLRRAMTAGDPVLQSHNSQRTQDSHDSAVS